MKLTIYDRNGNERVTVSPSGDAVQTKEIQGDNVLSLSVTLPGSVAFDINDYADFMGERYRLTERPHPEMKSRCEWVYNLRMYGIESLLKRFLVLNLTDGDTEPVFTLTAPPAEHLRLIVDCINRGMGSTSWKPGIAAGTDNIVIDYAGKYCDQALQELAEKMKAEWWVDGMNVNLCRCEQGEELTLAYGGGLTELVPGTADNVPFYTRLYPVGSSRNIDREKYGAARLLLPGGRKYVDLPLAARYGIADRYEQDAFAGIYPRYTGTVGAVRTEKRKDNDGREYTVYFFTDPGLDIDFGAYLLPGQAMRVSFQEGSELAGLGESDDHFFEVDFNSDRREFEIVTTWPYGDDMQLPGGTLVPKAGDRYIPWNIRMPEEYHRLAEAELLDAVERYNAENARDVAVYRATTDHTWVEATGAELFPGRRVRLEHAGYFPDTGFRSSRITKVVRRLDLPSHIELEIGDALSTTGMERMSGEIEGIRNVTRRLSASMPAVIGVADETKPTDYNLFSALRSLREFVSRRHDDRAAGVITFLRGLLFGDGSHGIGGDGAAVLESVVSKVFRGGFTGEGFRLWLDEVGLANLEVDKLTVRQQMRIFELLAEKMRSIGGHLIISAANGKVKEVIEEGTMYRLALEGENMFMADDLIRCQQFTGNSLKSYWVKASSAGSTGILVAKSEFSSLPEAGDDIVLCGNTTNPARQSVISISAAEDGIPRIEVLDRISSKSFSGCLRVRIGSLDNIVDAYYNDMPAEQRPHGYGLYSDNAFLRGVFMLRNGDNIETRFSVIDGKVESMVSATEQGFLSDPWFVKDNGSWTVLSSVLPLTLGGKVIKAGGTNIVMKGGLSGIEMRGTRKAMHISGGSVSQRSDKFRVIPAFDISDGNVIPRNVRLSVMYRCNSEGYLTASIHGAVGMGNSHPLYGTAHVDVSDELRQTDFDGLWNGTGDLRISFTGDMDVYGAILTTDMGGDLSNRYRTLFEQDEKILKLVSAIVDGDERLIREMGLVISAGDKSGLYYRDASGKTAFVGIVQDGKVILNGEEIELRGVTVINDKFKVDSNGYLTVTGGTVGGFDIGEDFIGSKSLFVLDDRGNITLDENGNKVRDKYGKGMMLDADSIVFGTKFQDNGHSWYYDMQAEMGCIGRVYSGMPVGQFMLQKLVNAHTGTTEHYNVGTEYDIKGSSVGNLAFCGRGSGVLNGMIDGYGLIVQRYAVNGYVQISPLRDGNRALLISASSDVRWMLPRLYEMKTLLREDIGYLSDEGTSYDNPFCFSLTLFGHPSAYGSRVYGRTSGQQPPYIFPRLFNVSRQPVEYFELLPMEAVQVWLVYNPFDSTEANRYMAFVK